MQRTCLKTSFVTFHAALLKTRLASSMLTPSAKQQYSWMQKRIKFAYQSTKQLKFEYYLLNLPRTYAPHHLDKSPGWHTASVPSGPTCMQPIVGRPQ
jgi:hypothetical protein